MKWKVGMSVTYTGTEDGEMFTSVKDVKKASKLLKILGKYPLTTSKKYCIIIHKEITNEKTK